MSFAHSTAAGEALAITAAGLPGEKGIAHVLAKPSLVRWDSEMETQAHTIQWCGENAVRLCRDSGSENGLSWTLYVANTYKQDPAFWRVRIHSRAAAPRIAV